MKHSKLSTLIKVCGLIVFLSVGWKAEDGKSKEVTIALVGGQSVRGEILFVGDTCVIAALAPGLSESEIEDHPGIVRVLPNRSIVSISSAGASYTFTGVIAGMMIGSMAGCAAGQAKTVEQRKDDVFGCNAAGEQAGNTISGAAIGCMGGGIIGAMLGNAASGAGDTLISPSNRHFEALTSVTRYTTSEPEYLQRIVSH